MKIFLDTLHLGINDPHAKSKVQAIKFIGCVFAFIFVCYALTRFAHTFQSAQNLQLSEVVFRSYLKVKSPEELAFEKKLKTLSETDPIHLNKTSDPSKYSFNYVSLGFDLKDITFLHSQETREIEARLEQIFPDKMQSRAKEYIRPILLISEKHQIDPFWVISIMWTESHFIWTAESKVGARGLMQVMPATKAEIYTTYKASGKSFVSENPQIDFHETFKVTHQNEELETFKRKVLNIEIGVIYLKFLLKKFNHNHKLATVAYNMGPGWTAMRLRKGLPVGQKNLYLTKVQKAYRYISSRI